MRRLATSFIIIYCTAVSAALAHEGMGRDAEWFRSLLVPGTTQSCCNESDCEYTDQWRLGPKGFEVLRHDKWVVVPQDRVLVRKGSPTLKATVCWDGNAVRCFVPGFLV